MGKIVGLFLLLMLSSIVVSAQVPKVESPMTEGKSPAPGGESRLPDSVPVPGREPIKDLNDSAPGRKEPVETLDSVGSPQKGTAALPPVAPDEPSNQELVPPAQTGRRKDGFQWGPAFKQTLMFLGVQHGYDMTQPKTQNSLKGPFFRDYFRSVRSLHGWSDGGRFFTNYVAHPMEGSFLGFVQVQNDPGGRHERFGSSGSYWKSRLKAMAWSAAWSTQFEIGPISQASIGNVGLHGKQTYIDIVITPTVGLGLLIAEDVLDRYIIKRIESYSKNRFVKFFSRMVFNPTRTMANVIQFNRPWYRDKGLR